MLPKLMVLKALKNKILDRINSLFHRGKNVNEKEWINIVMSDVASIEATAEYLKNHSADEIEFIKKPENKIALALKVFFCEKKDKFTSSDWNHLLEMLEKNYEQPTSNNNSLNLLTTTFKQNDAYKILFNGYLIYTDKSMRKQMMEYLNNSTKKI